MDGINIMEKFDYEGADFRFKELVDIISFNVTFNKTVRDKNNNEFNVSEIEIKYKYNSKVYVYIEYFDNFGDISAITDNYRREAYNMLRYKFDFEKWLTNGNI
jgi:hypothetical protein